VPDPNGKGLERERAGGTNGKKSRHDQRRKEKKKKGKKKSRHKLERVTRLLEGERIKGERKCAREREREREQGKKNLHVNSCLLQQNYLL